MIGTGIELIKQWYNFYIVRDIHSSFKYDHDIST